MTADAVGFTGEFKDIAVEKMRKKYAHSSTPNMDLVELLRCQCRFSDRRAVGDRISFDGETQRETFDSSFNEMHLIIDWLEEGGQ